MPPFPTAMILDRDPGAQAQLALPDLDVAVLAHLVLAAGPLIGRHLCVKSATCDPVSRMISYAVDGE